VVAERHAIAFKAGTSSREDRPSPWLACAVTIAAVTPDASSSTRSWIFALAVLAAGVTTLFAITSAGAAPTPSDVLPDLVADPVADVVLSTDASGAADRLLLRFAGFVHNAGQGAVEIRGSRASTAAAMSVDQRVFNAAGGSRYVPSPAQIAYEEADGHGHWHLMRAARYSLWNSARSAEAAPAMKVGFCLEDSQHVDAHGPGSYVYGGSRDHRFCEWGNPSALSVFQGISAGWRDEYDNELAFQWVDVSDVQPGSYWLRSDVDPDGVVVESVEANQVAWASSATTIPGYVAQAVAGGQVESAAPVTVTLSAQRFGDPGAAEYRVESGPAHGALDLATGASRSSPAVVYSPQAGFQGTDSFTYSASDASSAFPRSPAVATVTVSVAAPASPVVRISGAPETMLAGTSAQLQAAVTNDPPSVTWSVDGAVGGDPAHGTVAADGLYLAPASPPGSGTVTIAARSARGGYDERRVRIVPPPAPQPAPLPSAARGGSPLPPSSRVGLTAPQVVRIGRQLILSTTPRRSGVVRLMVYAAGRLLGSCSTRTPANRRFTCRLWIERPFKVTVRISVVASLRVNGRVVAVKTRWPARVPAGHVH